MADAEETVSGEQPAPQGRRRRRGEQQSYGRTAKVGALWSVARQGVGQCIAIPSAMIMARLLGPDDFGIAAAAGFFITLAGRLTELGLNTALVRVKDLRREHTASVFVVSAVLAVAAWLGLTAAAPWMGRYFRSESVAEVIPVAALAFLFSPFSTVPSALLHRQFRFRANSVAHWADGVTGAVLAIGLAWAGFGFWSLVYSQLVAGAMNVVVKLYFTRWRPTFGFSWSAFRELCSFGLGIQVKRGLEFGAQNLDNLLIGRLIGIGALGLYDKAYMTTQRLLQLLNLGPAVSFRIFAVIQEDTARFRRAYQKVLLTVGLIGFPPLAVCIVVAPQLFEVMYGTKWLAAVPPFQILCAATIIKLASAHATRANEAKGMLWRQVQQHVLYVALIIVGVWVGSRWGITGAAWGVFAARLMLAILIQDLLRKSIEASWREMILPAVPGVLTAAAVAAAVIGAEMTIRGWVADPAAWQLLALQALVAGVSYAVSVLLSPFGAVRAVVGETLVDFAPRLARYYGNQSTPVPLREASGV